MASILNAAKTTVTTSFDVATKSVGVVGDVVDSVSLGTKMLHANVEEAHRNTLLDIARDRRDRKRERRAEDHERTARHFADVLKHKAFIQKLSDEERALYLAIHSDLSEDTEGSDEVLALL